MLLVIINSSHSLDSLLINLHNQSTLLNTDFDALNTDFDVWPLDKFLMYIFTFYVKFL